MFSNSFSIHKVVRLAARGITNACIGLAHDSLRLDIPIGTRQVSGLNPLVSSSNLHIPL